MAASGQFQARNDGARDLGRMLRQLGHYVEVTSDNDEEKLRSSGFQPLLPARNNPMPLSHRIRRIEPGSNSGTLSITLVADDQAGHYELQWAPSQADGIITGSWDKRLILQTRPPTLVTGLIPATYYAFQVRTLVGTGQFSDWSDSIVYLCR